MTEGSLFNYYWRKGGFQINDVVDCEVSGDLDDVPIPPNMEAEAFEAVVNVDKDIPTTGELTNEQLLFEAAQIRAAKRNKTDNNNHDQDDDLEDTVSNSEVVASLKNLRTFTQKQGLSESWVKSFFENMEKQMLQEISKNHKQENIKDYFEKLG